MRQAISGLDFVPILPLWLLGALALLALLALAPALWRRARGAGWRALSFAVLLLALANPRLVEETRETRPDIALLVQDRSDSARIGPRAAQLDAARSAIEQAAARFPDLELRTVDLPEGGRQGTRLFTAIDRALAEIPRARLAGIIALTDGQAHDIPAQPSFEAPLHWCCPVPRARRTGASASSRRRATASSAAAWSCAWWWRISARARRAAPCA
ncbi:hypothetical protein [Teichococcus aestuarii]